VQQEIPKSLNQKLQNLPQSFINFENKAQLQPQAELTFDQGKVVTDTTLAKYEGQQNTVALLNPAR
jgi:hypothetical protein